MPEAKISVILPVYNGMKYLRSCVESVLSQTYEDFEFLILDDCSTDGSWDYLNSIKDDRITLRRNETNKKLFYNLNYMVQHSTAPLIKLWSQDDIMYPDALETIVGFHEKHPDIGFSYSAVSLINEHGVEYKPPYKDSTPEIIDQAKHARICCRTGSIAGNIANVTLTRKAINKVGLFREDMIISGDFDMWVRIAEFYKIGFIKSQLIYLRNHSGQLSKQDRYMLTHVQEDISVFKHLFTYIDSDTKKECVRILKDKKLMFYYTLMIKSLLKFNINIAAGYWKAIARLSPPSGLIMNYFRYIYSKDKPGY